MLSYLINHSTVILYLSLLAGSGGGWKVVVGGGGSRWWSVGREASPRAQILAWCPESSPLNDRKPILFWD